MAPQKKTVLYCGMKRSCFPRAEEELIRQDQQDSPKLALGTRVGGRHLLNCKRRKGKIKQRQVPTLTGLRATVYDGRSRSYGSSCTSILSPASSPSALNPSGSNLCPANLPNSSSGASVFSGSFRY